MSKKDLLIQATKEIMAQYTTKLTLRQIYYRLVAKQIIPNTQNQYKYLSKVLTEARKARKIPFSAIEDRSRQPIQRWYYFDTPEEHMAYLLEKAKEDILRYTINPWHEQDKFVEIWVEKQALEALFNEIAQKYSVSLITCKGYPSVTVLKDSADRIRQEIRNRKVEEVIILYFGDFDSSGKDIPKSIEKQFTEDFGVSFQLREIALTKEQIDEYNLPPAPAKRSDSRTADFIAEHGDMAVELDALEPDVLQGIIEAAIREEWDDKHYDGVIKPQIDEGKDYLKNEIEERFGDLLDG